MKWKIDKYGADTVKSWGYNIAPYVHPEKYQERHHFWQEVHQLREAGKFAEAWELTKKHKTPEKWQYKFDGEHGETWRQVYDLNEAGEYEQAHELVKQLHHANGWGPGSYGKRPDMKPEEWSEKMKYWMEKKEMMQNTGFTDLMKGLMTEDFIEDIVEVIEDMGGVEKIKEKFSNLAEEDLADRKFRKERETAAYTVATHQASAAVMQATLLDISNRRVIDTIAKQTKQLPEGTTCTSYASQLSCFMGSQLVRTPYVDDAPWPHEVLAGFTDAGLLNPTGPATQSVVSFPNFGEPTLGAITDSVRIVLTSGRACLSVVDSFSIDEFDWTFETANDYHKLNQPVELTQDEAALLSVKLWGEEFTPSKRLLVPVTDKAFALEKALLRATNPSQISTFWDQLGDETQCALLFDSNLPAWPACNPMDNGQMDRALWNEKMKLLKQTEHVFGKKVDMEFELLDALYKVNLQLVDVRYKKALGKMSPHSLYANPKQCFVIVQDENSKKLKSYPIDLISDEECFEEFGDVCFTEYYSDLVDADVGSPMLCAENGSVTFRGIAAGIVGDQKRRFVPADFNILAMGAHMKNIEAWMKQH